MIIKPWERGCVFDILQHKNVGFDYKNIFERGEKMLNDFRKEFLLNHSDLKNGYQECLEDFEDIRLLVEMLWEGENLASYQLVRGIGLMKDMLDKYYKDLADIKYYEPRNEPQTLLD